MTIQDLKNLDLYKCSLQDINKAEKVLSAYLKKLPVQSATWIELKNLHVKVSRARTGMNPEGFMIGYNIDKDRLPNNQSVL